MDGEVLVDGRDDNRYSAGGSAPIKTNVGALEAGWLCGSDEVPQVRMRVHDVEQDEGYGVDEEQGTGRERLSGSRRGGTRCVRWIETHRTWCDTGRTKLDWARCARKRLE